MTALELFVDGVGVWSAQLADFTAFRRWLDTGETTPPATARPAADVLPANERRRAPEHVLLAVDVAGQAVRMSGYAADQLPCVFSSAHGDQAVTDYMCGTLAAEPTALSPTRFHNSVHNAPAGYWTIATGCQAASAAVCGHHASLGAGLLEAAMLVVADNQSVLFVCSDIAGSGAIGAVTECQGAFGCALVLSPHRSERSLARLVLRTSDQSIHQPTGTSLLPAAWLATNSTAHAALPLLMLVAGQGRHYHLPAATQLGLAIHREELA